VVRDRIPDPNALETFDSSRLDWRALELPRSRDCLEFYRRLLSLRREHIVPRMRHACAIRGEYKVHDERGLTAHWRFKDQSTLILRANLGDQPLSGSQTPSSQILFASDGVSDIDPKRNTLPAWSVVWSMKP
jgi:maltooligosyltrehalose trehalohydrolase